MLNAISKKSFKTSPEVTQKSGIFPAPGWVILITLGIFIGSQAIALIIAEILLHAFGAYTSLENSSAAQFIFIFFAEGLAAGLAIWVLKEHGLKLKDIGLGRRPKWRDLGQGLLGILVIYGLLIVAGIIVNLLVPSITNEQQDVGFNSLNTFSDGILAFIALVILPPLGEETLVRGYLYSGLRSKWRFIPALLLTSLLFGAAHLATGANGLLWSGAIDTFLLSTILVYLREKTGALYAGMLVHSLNNVVAFGVHFHSASLLLK